MKKLLLILLCLLPLMPLAQQTYVPDDNFEAYLENHSMGNGIANDDYVTTANINTRLDLYLQVLGIVDLTGIEDFTALTLLWCNNQLTSLDVSQNTALIELNCIQSSLTSLDISGCTALNILSCGQNQLTTLDVSNNTALTELYCGSNQLITFDVSNNAALTSLDCGFNQLTSLDVSNNTALTYFGCNNNHQLTTLDLRNGNNANFTTLLLQSNPNLTCINVDDAAWSTVNWNNPLQFDFDPQQYFSNNCSGTAIEEQTTNKELLRTIDVLGRETKNKPLFYIYDDGTVEKRITIE